MGKIVKIWPSLHELGVIEMFLMYRAGIMGHLIPWRKFSLILERAWLSTMPLQGSRNANWASSGSYIFFIIKYLRHTAVWKRTINASPPTPNLKNRMLSMQLKPLATCLIVSVDPLQSYGRCCIWNTGGDGNSPLLAGWFSLWEGLFNL